MACRRSAARQQKGTKHMLPVQHRLNPRSMAAVAVLCVGALLAGGDPARPALGAAVLTGAFDDPPTLQAAQSRTPEVVTAGDHPALAPPEPGPPATR